MPPQTEISDDQHCLREQEWICARRWKVLHLLWRTGNYLQGKNKNCKNLYFNPRDLFALLGTNIFDAQSPLPFSMPQSVFQDARLHP
jgi:hypothetical protein